MSYAREDEVRLEVIKLQAELCRSLSDPKRLHIIQELRGGEKTVGKLAETLGLKQSNTSQHLSVLRKVGVVSSRREGSTVCYSLANPKIAAACDMVHEVIAEQLRNNRLISSLMQPPVSNGRRRIGK
ncbi:MAG: metalloregulator ArsR/SmtB family transcription factor [Chloroflexota bacterium]